MEKREIHKYAEIKLNFLKKLWFTKETRNIPRQMKMRELHNSKDKMREELSGILDHNRHLHGGRKKVRSPQHILMAQTNNRKNVTCKH